MLDEELAWRPSASIESLRARAVIINTIRRFFQERAYLEVETPIMAQHGVSDVYLSNIEARFRGRSYALQTSPEYHMKRLLAAGSGPIFQLARVFRDDELGRWHNPEFTLLEWYQLQIDHHALMQEMNEFLQFILACPPLIKKTYQQVFMETVAIDPLNASLADLRAVVERCDLGNVLGEETMRDPYLFLLMSHVVEPALAKEGRPVAVYDFPVSQAALAEAEGDVAHRFEVYYQGVELANGFHELTDPKGQQQRFEADNALRKTLGLSSCAIDPYFLAALNHGLPPCSGVALGVDRLVAIALQKNNLAEVQAFDISCA